MPLSLLALGALGIATTVLLVILAVQGFRTHAGWGCPPLLILVGPFAMRAGLGPFAIVIVLGGLIGLAIFAIMHPKRAGILFLLYLTSLGVSIALLFTSPPVIAFYQRINPAFGLAIKAVNPNAYAEAQKLPAITLFGQPVHPPASPATHEAHDLAENEAAPPTDPNAVQRAAYLKHMNDLNNVYQQLSAERSKLKTGSPAVAAFNAKAARYKQDVQTLAEEKTRLDALDRASNFTGEAPVTLASQQAAAGPR
jgi:hypothetical protein